MSLEPTRGALGERPRAQVVSLFTKRQNSSQLAATALYPVSELRQVFFTAQSCGSQVSQDARRTHRALEDPHERSVEARDPLVILPCLALKRARGLVLITPVPCARFMTAATLITVTLSVHRRSLSAACTLILTLLCRLPDGCGGPAVLQIPGSCRTIVSGALGHSAQSVMIIMHELLHPCHSVLDWQGLNRKS